LARHSLRRRRALSRDWFPLLFGAWASAAFQISNLKFEFPYSRQPFGQHGFARAGRTDQQNLPPARRYKTNATLTDFSS
jgi:hypothetical protein